MASYPGFLSKSRFQRGYNLLELTIIVIILGIMAAAVVPAFHSASPYKLELVAEEIASALRFARTESLRTGDYYGATISQVTQTITVKKWDISTDPVSTELIPYHPVSKKAFLFDADGMSLARGVSITNSNDVFLFDVAGRRRSVIFDPNGTPVWIADEGGSTYRLVEGSIVLGDGDSQRTVQLAALTGRVVVQ